MPNSPKNRVSRCVPKYRGKVRLGLGAASKGFRSKKFEDILKNSKCALDNLAACRQEFQTLQDILKEDPGIPVNVQSPDAWVQQGFGFLPMTDTPSSYGIFP